MPRNRKARLESIGEFLELPSGLLSGGAHIELRSNREAIIDGKCTVLEYCDTLIKINTGSGIVKITGRDLAICSLTCNSAIIKGYICTLDFTD